MAKIDLASNSALISVADKLDTQNGLLAAIAGGDGALPITSWSAVQSIVRLGLAPKVFSVGDSLTCNHEEFGTLTWDIVGIDCDTPVDKSKKHSLTLMLRSPMIKLPFSGAEALYFCSTEMVAGTYYFTIPKTSTSSARSYYFTTEQTHYSPNVFFFDNSAKKMIIYNDPVFSSINETVSVKSGASGTFMGIADGTTLNYGQRIIYGNESWKSSDIRQWLSSDAETWQVYSEDKGFYNSPSSYANRVGFLNKIDPEFAAVIGAVVKRTNCNQAIGGYTETEDKVFLPSITELYGSSTRCGEEGEAYPYFADYSDLEYPGDVADTNRIKFGITSDYGEDYILRSGNVNGDLGYVWKMSSTGDISSRSGANNTNNVVPMCCIV